MTFRARLLLAAVVMAVATMAVFAVVNATAPVDAAPIDSYQRSADPRKIIVTVTVGLGDEIVEHSAREDTKTVTVTVRVRRDTRMKPLIGIFLPVAISLRDPLGDRAVLDQSGRPVRDLGSYQVPQEPPIDLGEIGVIEKGSFRTTGDAVDFRWRDLEGTARSLADLRGSTVVILSRTSFSDEAKMNLLALQDYLGSATPEERARIVVLVITLNEDPARAAVARPTASFRPLLANADATGADAPEILRFTAVPVTWFVGPDGAVRHRVVGARATREEIVLGLAAAR